MFNLCDECDRLWREYAAATAEDILSSDRLKRATTGSETENIAALTEKAEADAAARENARLSIQRHESSVHRADARGAS